MGETVKNLPRKLEFSKDIYAAEAVKLAAYVFSGRADIKLSFSPRGVSADVPCAAGDGAVAGEFANEVLNQQCRLDLAARNGKITNMIVTKALLSALGDAKSGGK